MNEYAARIAESDRLQRGQEAEGQGLRAAALFAEPLSYSREPYLQARFLLGFEEGRSLLALQGYQASPARAGAGAAAP